MSNSEEQRDKKIIKALEDIATQLKQVNKTLVSGSVTTETDLVKEILDKVEDLRIGYTHGTLSASELNVALYALIRHYRGTANEQR